ncbi:FTR1 family iron permease [Selenomonas noxia]|uniref:FTR1 family iron permease n=1 Tax=Selenomonas noxia TaxID=135083 RepID=UPI00248C5A52|nr:FTR1 family protein [Selenomonas noxia]
MKKVLVFLAALLLFLPAIPADAAQTWQQIHDRIGVQMDQVYEIYKTGNAEGAKDAVNDIYYGIYEKDGLESAVRSGISSKSANLTEYQFYTLKKVIRAGAPQAEVEAEGAKLLDMIQAEVTTLETKGVESGGWAMFLQAFLILLREGIEAILVLVGIIAYLGRAGHEKELSTVYNWAIAGIIMSFVTAYLFVEVLDNTTTTGSGREIIEGCTALFAVLVLLGTSAWMGGKSNAKAWKSYIDKQVKLTLSTGKSRALGAAVFLAVYREGAEVILFYQALFNNAVGDVDMIWAGFVTACLALALIFFLMQRGALRIPIGPFFKVTSAFMFILAVTFLGGGLKELQEADVISTSVIEAVPVPSIDLLGLYPTYETIVPQILLILAAVAMVSYKKRSAASEA